MRQIGLAMVDLGRVIGTFLNAKKPLTGQQISELYAFIGKHPACHQLLVQIARSGGRVNLQMAEEIRLKEEIPDDIFYRHLGMMVAAFQPDSAAPASEVEPEARPKRHYQRRIKSRKTRRAKPNRQTKPTKGTPATLKEKVQHLVDASSERGETPRQTLKRLLAEYPGPREFCKFANPVLRKRGVRGFSPGQYHQLHK